MERALAETSANALPPVNQTKLRPPSSRPNGWAAHSSSSGTAFLHGTAAAAPAARPAPLPAPSASSRLRLPGPRYSSSSTSTSEDAPPPQPAAAPAPAALPPPEAAAVKPWQRSLNLLKKRTAAAAASAQPQEPAQPSALLSEPSPSAISSNSSSSGGGSSSSRGGAGAGSESWPGSYFPVDASASTLLAPFPQPPPAAASPSRGTESLAASSRSCSSSSSSVDGLASSFHTLPFSSARLASPQPARAPSTPCAAAAAAAAAAPAAAVGHAEDFLLLAGRLASLSPDAAYFLAASATAGTAQARAGAAAGPHSPPFAASARSIFSPMASAMASYVQQQQQQQQQQQRQQQGGEGAHADCSASLPVRVLFGLGDTAASTATAASAGNSLFDAAAQLEALEQQQEADAQGASAEWQQLGVAAAAAAAAAGGERAHAGAYAEAGAALEVPIPTLPYGQHVRVTVLSNWGDGAWVGLEACEFFSAEGRALATPQGAALAAGGQGWRAPFPAGDAGAGVAADAAPPSLDFTLPRPCALALMRIWNCCRGGRVRSFMGARRVRVALDGVVVFEGEVRRASGGRGGGGQEEGEEEEEREGGGGAGSGGAAADAELPAVLAGAETILFTAREDILAAIAANDPHAAALEQWRARVELGQAAAAAAAAAAVEAAAAAGHLEEEGLAPHLCISAADVSAQQRSALADSRGSRGAEEGACSVSAVDRMLRDLDAGADGGDASAAAGAGGGARDAAEPPSAAAAAAAANNSSGGEETLEAMLRALSLEQGAEAEAETEAEAADKRADAAPPSACPQPSSGLAAAAAAAASRAAALPWSALEATPGRIGQRLPLCSLPYGRYLEITTLSTWAGEEAGSEACRAALAPCSLSAAVALPQPPQGAAGGSGLGLVVPCATLSVRRTARGTLRLDLGGSHYIAGLALAQGGVAAGAGAGAGSGASGGSGSSAEEAGAGARHIAVAIEGLGSVRAAGGGAGAGAGAAGCALTVRPLFLRGEGALQTQHFDFSAPTPSAAAQVWSTWAQAAAAAAAPPPSPSPSPLALLPPPPLPALAPPATSPSALRALLSQDFEPCHGAGPPATLLLRMQLSPVSAAAAAAPLQGFALYDAAGARIPLAPWQVAYCVGACGSGAQAQAQLLPLPSCAFAPPAQPLAQQLQHREARARCDDPWLYRTTAAAQAPEAEQLRARQATPLPAQGLTLFAAFDAPVAVGLIRFFFAPQAPPPAPAAPAAPAAAASSVDAMVWGDAGWPLCGGRLRAAAPLPSSVLALPAASLLLVPSAEVLGSDAATGVLCGSSATRPAATLLFNEGAQVQ